MKIKSRIEPFIKCFAYSMMLSCFVCLFITFVIAYFNPGRSIVIYIDNYGEANLELFLFCLGAVSISYIIHKDMKDENQTPTNAAAE